MLTAYFEVIQEHFFREVTYSILRRCDDGKKDQVCCLKDGTDGVVSTVSTTTSNPLSTCIATTSLVRMTGEGRSGPQTTMC